MKRQSYLDVLRVIASVLIVCVHVSALCWNDVSVTTSNWQVMSAFDCIGIVGVPLFFMISGSIFLNENYNISVKKLLVGKVFHLFIVYHLWLLFYNVLPFIYGELTVSTENIKEQLYKLLTGNGIYHLWFLPELVILYLISPILREAFKNRKICEYYLAIYAITGGVLVALLYFDFPYKVFLESYYNRSSLVMLTGYIGYFVLGHYINSFLNKEISNRCKTLLITAFVLGMTVIIVVCGMDAIKKGEPSGILNTPFTLSHIVVCFSVFWLIKAECNNRNGKLINWSKSMSKYTFGVYLLHPFVIQLLDKFGVKTTVPHSIIMIPVLVALVYTISFIMSYVLSKIPGISRTIM